MDEKMLYPRINKLFSFYWGREFGALKELFWFSWSVVYPHDNELRIYCHWSRFLGTYFMFVSEYKICWALPAHYLPLVIMIESRAKSLG